MLSLPTSALERIDVFTVDGLDMPLSPLQQVVDVTPEIHVVDELKRIEDTLSQGIPNNEEEATKVAMKRLQGKSFIDQTEAAKRGMDAVILADKLRLEAIPAVVFDRHYIVYGEQPLAAYRIYQQRREAEQ